MLRALTQRLIHGARQGRVATRAAATGAVEVEPPKPPADLDPKLFEWEYLIENADSDEEKKAILQLKSLYSEAELLHRKEFETTVDWNEFEGKVPEKILQKYKDVYAQAVKDYDDGKFDWQVDETEWNKTRDALMNTVKEIVDSSNARLKVLEAEIEKTEGKMARLETATVEEELALDPELAKRVDDAVSEELGYTR